MKRVLRAISIALFALLCSGCSTLRDYTSATRTPYHAFRRGEFEVAANTYERGARRGRDRLSYLYELGVVRHSGGCFEESNEALREAVALVREFDQRATVAVRDTAATVGTLILNEKAAPYRGEAFERVYAHTFAALNHLMLGDYTGARVEARQAFYRQRLERLRFQDEYDAAVSEARERGVFSEEAMAKAKAEYGDAPEVEIFQDAFAHYLASVVFEIGGEYQPGMVEMRNLLRFKGGSALAQQQMTRLQAKWAPTVAGDEGRALLPGEGEGEVVVFYLCGEAPLKREAKITLPLPTPRGWTLNTVAFPRYQARPNPVASARVSVGETLLGQTETLSDVEAKAKATLARRVPTLVVKSLLRASGRFAVQTAILYSGGDSRGPGGEGQALRRLLALLVGVASHAIEQADLRSWLTLPHSFQATRGVVPAGRHELALDLVGAAGAHRETIEIMEGGITVVVARSVGTRVIMHSRAYPRR